MRRLPALALALTAPLLLAGAPAAAQSGAQPPAQSPVPPAAQSAPLLLQPGDFVRVSIWREPALSGDFMVEEDSTTAFPLLGRLRTAGVPWRALRDVLLAGYQREVTSTSMVVTPLRRIFVLGAVERPGVHLADLTVGVDAVVAMAGGPSDEGAIDRVRLVRNGQTIARRLDPGDPLSRLELRSGDQIIFDRRSWWERNSVVLFTSLLSLMGVVAVLVKP